MRLLWRLRRATAMETGLFEIQADHLRVVRHFRQVPPTVVQTMLGGAGIIGSEPDSGSDDVVDEKPGGPGRGPQDGDLGIEFARCFLRLANLPSYPLDRLSRYEATLWRQAGQILFALDALSRRRPLHRIRHFRSGLGEQRHFLEPTIRIPSLTRSFPCG